MQKVIPLEPGKYYHIFTRGNNQETIFPEERNYAYFLQLYRKHVSPVADTFAYCLLKNHFHFLVRIKETCELAKTSQVSETCEVSPAMASRSFSNLLNAYTKAINKAYGRTGSLFQERSEKLKLKVPTTSAAWFTTSISIRRNTVFFPISWNGHILLSTLFCRTNQPCSGAMKF